MLQLLKENFQYSAYLYFPTRHFSQYVLATHPQVPHGYAAVRDARFVGEKDRVEMWHTGHSKSSTVYAAVAVVAAIAVGAVDAVVAVAVAVVSKVGSQKKRVRSKGGDSNYGSNGDLVDA